MPPWVSRLLRAVFCTSEGVGFGVGVTFGVGVAAGVTVGREGSAGVGVTAPTEPASATTNERAMIRGEFMPIFRKRDRLRASGKPLRQRSEAKPEALQPRENQTAARGSLQ